MWTVCEEETYRDVDTPLPVDVSDSTWVRVKVEVGPVCGTFFAEGASTDRLAGGGGFTASGVGGGGLYGRKASADGGGGLTGSTWAVIARGGGALTGNMWMVTSWGGGGLTAWGGGSGLSP